MPRVLASEYPHPRYDRDLTGVTGILTAADIQVPIVRLWTFQLREATAGARGTVVSPAFRGPSIIKELSVQVANTGPTTTAMNLQVYLSPSPGINGPNQLAAAIPPGVPIYEESFSNDGGFAEPNRDGLWAGDQIGAAVVRHILNRVVTDDQFFLNVSIAPTSASAWIINGLIRVYDRVPLELIQGLIAD